VVRSARDVVWAARLSLAGGAALCVSGLIDRSAQWPLVTATLGPTAYVFAAHPGTKTATRRNAIVGHGVAIATALATLAAFGLWDEPPHAAVGHVTLPQVFATTVALSVTLFILELTDHHHAPSAATVVLITAGFTPPGTPLYGLICGLALVIVISPLLSAAPPGAAEEARRRHGVAGREREGGN
jgi:hypothetical protein